MKEIVPELVSMGCITVLAIGAMATHIDHGLVTGAIGAIAGLGGYVVGRHQRKKVLPPTMPPIGGTG